MTRGAHRQRQGRRSRPPARRLPRSRRPRRAAPTQEVTPARRNRARPFRAAEPAPTSRSTIPPVNVLSVAGLEELAADDPGRGRGAAARPDRTAAGLLRGRGRRGPRSRAARSSIGCLRRCAACSTRLSVRPRSRSPRSRERASAGAPRSRSACDLVLAAEDARIGFPEIRLACFPPGAAALLPARIGEARATSGSCPGASCAAARPPRPGSRRAPCRRTGSPKRPRRLAARIVARPRRRSPPRSTAAGHAARGPGVAASRGRGGVSQARGRARTSRARCASSRRIGAADSIPRACRSSI